MRKLPRFEKKTTWRNQRQKKQKRRKKIIFSLLLLFAGILFVLLIFKVWTSFRQSRWLGQGRISLVFSCNPLTIFSYQQIKADDYSYESTLSVVSIPEKTLIKTIHGYGDYRIESLPKLEVLEKRNLISESLENTLSIPIEGFVNLGDCSLSGETEAKNIFLKGLLQSFFSNGRTNLSKWDLIRLFWSSRNLKVEQIKRLDLETAGITSLQTLPDGSQLLKISPEKMEAQAAEFFRDEVGRRESLAIEVLNATDYPGLGERAVRILSNLGLEVVRVGNESHQYKECLLLGSRLTAKTYTVRRLREIFNCTFKEEELQRADLSLILGQDYFAKLEEK